MFLPLHYKIYQCEFTWEKNQATFINKDVIYYMMGMALNYIIYKDTILYDLLQLVPATSIV